MDIDILDARWRKRERERERERERGRMEGRRGTQSVSHRSRRNRRRITTYGELDGISDNAVKAEAKRSEAKRRRAVVIDREHSAFGYY